jgi:uncharacterized protein YndB with AHSA1/START domain
MPERTESVQKTTIEKRVWIKAAAEIVFRALTSSKELEKWFCDRAECTPSKGGELIAYWGSGKHGHRGRAVFTDIVPPALLELLWIEEGKETTQPPSRHLLRYTIKSKSGMTEVAMLDRDETPLDDGTYASMDRGWNLVLLELKDFCERRERIGKMRLEHRSGALDT